MAPIMLPIQPVPPPITLAKFFCHLTSSLLTTYWSFHSLFPKILSFFHTLFDYFLEAKVLIISFQSLLYFLIPLNEDCINDILG